MQMREIKILKVKKEEMGATSACCWGWSKVVWTEGEIVL